MKVLRIAGAVLLVVVLLVFGIAGYLSAEADRRLERTFETHRVDIPVPFPLTEAEVSALREERRAAMADADAGVDPLEGVDLTAVATQRAVDRGRYLIFSRYACFGCHGVNLGGGVMIDDPAIGNIPGRNITTGKGGVVATYTVADWDRIIRHGVKPDGTAAVMPSTDFLEMTDRELSDIIAFIRAQPAVDNEVPPPVFGPVGTMLIARGQIRLTAEEIPDHHAAHTVEPPPPEDTLAVGKHFAQVCTGCHQNDFSGGPIQGGPPDWPPASNLTPHERALKDWTEQDFITVMRTATRKDGTRLRPPMNEVAPMMASTRDEELKALFAYLRTLPPRPPRE